MLCIFGILEISDFKEVGERIAREELEHKDRADYGKRVIESLARDIGSSRRSMYEIVQFYKAYPIVHTLSAQLSWSNFDNSVVRIKLVY